MLSFIIYLSFLVNGILCQVCEDAYSCIGCDRNDNECTSDPLYGEAYCYGFQSCIMNKFLNMNKVECLGGDSCKEVKAFIANESVTCSGYEACYQIRDITSLDSWIKCSGDKSCRNGDLTAVNGDILCSGHSSCIKSKAETSSLSCLGFKSCQQINHAGILSNAHCEGRKACGQSTFVADNIYCRGKQSCEKMGSLIVSDTVYGYGYQSLYLANIYDTKTINAYGYRSIEQATIDSGNLRNTEMIINAFGFAASLPGKKKQRTSILCRNSTICSINCGGDGCKGIVLTCLSGSICNISPYDCQINHADASFSKQEWMSCPEFISSEGSQQDQLLINRFETSMNQLSGQEKELEDINKVINEIESQYEQLSELTDDDDKDEKEKLSVYKQIELEMEMESLQEEQTEDDDDEDSVSTEIYPWDECDDTLECQGRLFNTSTPEAFCLGYMSCLEAEFDYDGDIQCYGYKSCMNASTIYTSGARTEQSRDTGTSKGLIRCASAKSCYNAESISAKETVSCLGRLSCAYSGLIESRFFTVKCDGSMSCINSSIDSPKKIECSSYQSCFGSNVTTQTITCNGPESCKATLLTADTSIKCEGTRSCSDSIITSSMYKTYGYFDSINSIIYANMLYGYGYGSLAFSHIRSIPGKSIKVFSYGYDSGYGVDYDCESNAVCRLYCLYNGCDNLHFNCFLGSKCFVYLNGTLFKDPSEFDEYNTDHNQTNNILMINGTVTPKWQYAKVDKELTTLIQERRLNNKYDQLYQKVINEKITSAHIYDEKDEMEEMMYDLEMVENVRIDTNGMLLNGQQSINMNQWMHAIILTILGIMLSVAVIVSYYKCLKIKPQDLKPEYQPLLI